MTETNLQTKWYAAMLRLDNRLCTVIGGGAIAARKVERLLEAGARVRVISPALHVRMQAWVEAGVVEYHARTYCEGDVADAWLIVAATDRSDVNQAVAKEAERLGKWVNVVDDPTRCSLIVPAVVCHGDVQVAVSTSGIDPSAAKQMKNALVADLAEDSRRFQETIKDWTRRTDRGDGGDTVGK